MAVYTYGADDIEFSTFDIWSNAGFTDNTNIQLDTVLTDAFPVASGSYGVDEIYNRSWFYGSAIAESGNGTVQVTYPYTSAATTGSLQVKNVDYGVFSYVRLSAVGTYPYVFSEWRTASGGTGIQISTNADLDLTVTDQLSQINFYAYFV